VSDTWITTDYTDDLRRHPPVAWRPGFALPRRFRAKVNDPQHPYLVDLDLSVHEGEVQCDSVRISRRSGGPPVTARRARLPLDRYVREAAVCAAWRITGVKEDGTYVLEPMESDSDDDRAWTAARPGRRKTRWKMTDEHLKAVAEVYRANPKRPRQAVQNDPQWAPLEPSTAARWIRAAKDAGLLEERPAPSGRGQSKTKKGKR
jgi:hypothetical protein